MDSLTQVATKEDILNNLHQFKITTANLITKIVTDSNAQHLEPKEIKTLVDTALNIEDSLVKSDGSGEGEQARTMQRLLDKYSDKESYYKPSLPLLDSVSSDSSRKRVQ